MAPAQSTTPGSQVVRHRYVRQTRATQMDIAVTDIDQTITDCLVDASFVEGLIIADSALHEQLLSKEHLVEAVDKLGLNRRGVVTARRVARYADGPVGKRWRVQGARPDDRPRLADAGAAN